jgi:hypothetical protein
MAAGWFSTQSVDYLQRSGPLPLQVAGAVTAGSASTRWLLRVSGIGRRDKEQRPPRWQPGESWRSAAEDLDASRAADRTPRNPGNRSHVSSDGHAATSRAYFPEAMSRRRACRDAKTARREELEPVASRGTGPRPLTVNQRHLLDQSAA